MIATINTCRASGLVQCGLHSMIARNKPPPCAGHGTYTHLVKAKSSESGPCSRFLPCSFTRMGLPPQIGVLRSNPRIGTGAKLGCQWLPDIFAPVLGPGVGRGVGFGVGGGGGGGAGRGKD